MILVTVVSMRCGLRLWPILLVTLAGGPAAAEDFEDALAAAREAALNHRYNQVIDILTPFNSVDDPEKRYITAAEIGRAYFHLGRYSEAHRAFREAVTLHPERAESAIYLEATSYLVGDRNQAYTIFRELLKSGARDLYLAVTLPGERTFAGDPQVQAILDEYLQPLEVDLERAEILGLRLGEDRDKAVRVLDARSSNPTAAALTASAGPALIWAFVFDDGRRLDEVVLQAENLLRYTPYRLDFGNQIDWRVTPASAIAIWGPPNRTEESVDGGIAVGWSRPTFDMTLEFGRPRAPQPQGITEGTAMLRSVQLKRRHPASPDRIDR